MPRYRFPEPSLTQRRRRAGLWKRRLITIGTVIVCAAILSLFFLPGLRITSINVSGATTVSQSDIAQTAESILNGRYLFIFPKADTLVYPKSVIVDSLEKQFPAIASLKVSRDGLSGLNVDITERQAAALWCADSSTSSPCDSVDATGFIFAPASLTPGATLVRFSGIPASSTPAIGSNYIPTGDFQALLAFLSRLPTLGLSVVSIEPLPPSDWQVDLASGGSIDVSGTASYDDTYTNVAALLGDPTFKTQMASQQLDYLDARYGTKIFYKFEGSASTSNQ